VTRYLFLSALLATAGAAACTRHDTPAPGATETVTAAVERVSAAIIPETFEAGGVVRARSTATLASRVTAPVDAVYAAPGAKVRKGATLVALESRELQANAARAKASLAAAIEGARAAESEVAAAESALALARVTHERMRTLFDKRSATAQEWDQASAGLQGADARVGTARAQAAAARAVRDAADATVHAVDTALSYETIAAPFDAVVAERLVDPGTMATAGTPLMVVEDPSALLLHVLVDEARARAITVGQTADARLDQDADWSAARVVEIGRVDPASHNFLVKLQMPAGAGVRSGLFGRARFTSGERRAVAVPSSSIVRRGQLAFVFALTPERIARLRPIVTGETIGGRVEVLAGLSEGDTIVVTLSPKLADGVRVAGQS
jgi:RND family efflux transporter MFP subunit